MTSGGYSKSWRFSCGTTGSDPDTWTTDRGLEDWRRAPAATRRLPDSRCMGGSAARSVVWLVGYSGGDGFEAAEERYHALAGTTIATPNPSDFVEAATLDMVDGLLRDHEPGDMDAGLGNLSSELPRPLRARTCCPCPPASCRLRHQLRLSSDPRVSRPVGACRRTPEQCCRDPWRSGAGRLHPL